MLTKLREPFGKAGLIVAIVALIAALGGGAYAASGGLTGKQKKEVTAIAKKYAGKPGAPGATGPAGAPGKDGTNGTNGTGTNGTNGTPGTNGKSVEEIPIAEGEPTCGGRGGAEYLLEGEAGGTEICNGKEGSPWALGGLPKGATETGAWTLSASEASANEEEKVFVPLSFPVRLSAPITEASKVHFVNGETGDATCTGTAAEPTAPEGQLCIYYAEYEHATFAQILQLEGMGVSKASRAGAYLVFREVGNHAFGYGSWAVTGS